MRLRIKIFPNTLKHPQKWSSFKNLECTHFNYRSRIWVMYWFFCLYLLGLGVPTTAFLRRRFSFSGSLPRIDNIFQIPGASKLSCIPQLNCYKKYWKNHPIPLYTYLHTSIISFMFLFKKEKAQIKIMRLKASTIKLKTFLCNY